MSAPTPSDLDFSQCIQGAYNGTDGSFRVDANITAPLDVNGDVLVDIRASDGDSVLVYGTQNGTPTGTQQILKINPDGSVNVDATIIGSPNVNIHDSTGNNLTSTSGSLNVNLTNSTIAVTQSTSPWIISGNVNASQSGTWTVQQGSAPWSVSQSGVWTTGRTWTLSSSTDSVNIGNFPATQAVTQSTSPWIISGTVTANAGTGTFAVSDSITHTDLSTINTTLGSPFQAGGSIANTSFIVTQSSGTNLHVNIDNFPAIQPVSGTITALQGTSPWVVSGTVTTSPNVNVHDGSGNSIGSTSGSLNVDVTNIVPVSQSGTWNLNNITGTVSLPTGASTSANQTNGTQITQVADASGHIVTIKPASTATVATDTSLVVALSPNSSLPTGTNTIGTINPQTSSVSTVTSVASSATNVVLLASNATRKGAVFYNNSASVCYMKLGVTASSTSFTIAMAPLSTFIIDSNPIYNGEVDGIWVTANGDMLVTELT